MKYRSTAGRVAGVRFGDALLAGPAPDGGLFMPERLPRLSPRRLKGMEFPDLAFHVATPFVGDEIPAADLRRILRECCDFDVPIRAVTPAIHVVELFHGPTMSFKDFGAGFMARAMDHVLARRRRRAIALTATSGDTGGAVAHAFAGMDRVRAVIVYPRGRVSPFQRRQMTAPGGNVTVAEIDGDFDACQAMVKRAMADPALARLGLTSANSINIGRLLPQMFYSIHARLRAGAPASLCVPSGNFGNVTAALMAREMGIPFRRVLAATNVNDAVPRFLRTGRFEPRATRATMSNAMDVGAPGNLARIRDLFGPAVRRAFASVRVTDAQTRETMRRVHRRHGYLLDPHGAVGWRAIESMGGGERWLLLETAAPEKFAGLVRRVVGARVAPPRLPDRPVRRLRAEYDALKQMLEALAGA